jgi:tetratricopeptide (TPR) repeat protein
MKTLIDRLKKLDKSAIIIFFSALILRLIYIIQLQDSPFFNFPQIDTLWHHLWANEIAAGNVIGNEVFFRAPLYPYFLSLIYSVFGDGPFAYRVIQSVIGSLSCVLIYLIGRDLFNKRTAIIAGIIAAFYSIFIYFDNELLITNLFVFLTLLLFLITLRTDHKSSLKRFFLIGLICGLAAIARPTILILFPLLIYYLFLHHQKWSGKNLVPVLFLIAGMLIMILPVTIRNYAVGKDVVLISYQGGVNFWAGNNLQADGKTAGAPGYYKAYGEYQDNVKFSGERTAELDLGRDMKPSEITGYWYKKGFEYIFGNPVKYIALEVKKLYFTWNAYEIESNRDIYSQRPYSSLLSILLWHNIIGFPFGLIAPLALLGIFLAIKNWNRRYLLLLGFLFIYQIVLLLFFVTARFRAPILPFIIILAAFAIDYLIGFRKKKQSIMIPAVILIVGLVISNRTLGNIMPSDSARSKQATAEVYLRQNQPDSAIVYARMAVEENPGNPESLAFLGTAYEQNGDYRRAANTYEKSARLNPNDAFVQNHLGYSLYKTGVYDQALTACLNALRIDSTIIEIYTNLGNIYKDLGRQTDAFTILQKGYQIDSTNVSFLNNYAVILREYQDYPKAISILKRVTELQPNYLPGHVNLANLYFQTGNALEAESEYFKALRIDEDNIEANLNLAQLYIRTGRQDKALPLIRKVLDKNPNHPTATRLLQAIQ